MKARALLLMLSLGWGPAVATDLGKLQPLTDAEWAQVQERMALLNDVSHIPSLLPVIMANRDALELTPEQLALFRNWRRDNYQTMVDTMNHIIERRIQLAKRSLDPGVDGADLLAMQQDIFALQRELLRIRLTCRQHVMATFSEAQWASFAFIVADDGQMAGLLNY